MKILKSASLILAVVFVVASLCGLQVGLQLALLCFGIKEIGSAVEYYVNKKKKYAMASLDIGIFVCVCALLSVTNII